MKCPRCGTEYNSPFCPQCGFRVAPPKKKLHGCLLSFIVTAGASLLLVICIAVGMMNAIIRPSAAVSAAFAIPVVVCLLGTVVSGIIFIVMAALKKHRLVTGLLLAGFGGAFILFTALGVMTSPATWCEHEFEVISERPATCTEDGEIVRLCALCDTERTETVEATGHDMVEVSSDGGEIITRCSVCGYEEIDVVEIDGISASRSASAPEVSDSPYSAEFLAACAEIGLDVSEIMKWEQIDDWANGERFRFTYKGQSVVASVNFDKTIKSISIGQTHVYEQGYEPYNIEDYIVDEDTAMALIPYAEDTVKLALNYPATADFPLLDWGYGREGDIYILQSTVTAANGFGVREEMPFTVMFDLSTEGKAICVYLELAGSIVADDRGPRPERQRVASEGRQSAGSKEGEIRLIDGELGEYGRTDPKYPEYIDYYVPAGRYSVVNNAKNSIVMVIDNASNEEVSRETLAEGQSGEILIGVGQHIELTVYSDVVLIPIS